MSRFDERWDTAVDAMWSSALARGLVRDDAMRAMRCRDGYTDLLGPSTPPRRSLARLVMRGARAATAPDRAATALRLAGEQRVLDVACGPGDFTAFFADRLGGDGFVIGLDDSLTMIERAVHHNSRTRAVYMRADTLSLPFGDCAFDVVCCFTALYLMPDPFGMLIEMVRVLQPGGTIAVTAGYRRESALVRKAIEVGATVCGMRVFDHATIPAFLAAAGLLGVDQHRHGISQLVIARRPDRRSIGSAR
jgi:SAM-dependent methyltransferase